MVSLAQRLSDIPRGGGGAEGGLPRLQPVPNPSSLGYLTRYEFLKKWFRMKSIIGEDGKERGGGRRCLKVSCFRAKKRSQRQGVHSNPGSST
jgi:hypothetical protein